MLRKLLIIEGGEFLTRGEQTRERLNPTVETETECGAEWGQWGGGGEQIVEESWDVRLPPSVTHRQPCYCQHDQQGRGICLSPPPATTLFLSLPRATTLFILLLLIIPSCSLSHASFLPYCRLLNLLKPQSERWFTLKNILCQHIVQWFSKRFGLWNFELAVPHHKQHKSSAQLNQRLMCPSQTVSF